MDRNLVEGSAPPPSYNEIVPHSRDIGWNRKYYDQIMSDTAAQEITPKQRPARYGRDRTDYRGRRRSEVQGWLSKFGKKILAGVLGITLLLVIIIIIIVTTERSGTHKSIGQPIEDD